MQHEHLRQKASSIDRTALHAEFLQTHVVKHPKSADLPFGGMKRFGFSAFLLCFLEAELWDAGEPFLLSGFFKFLLHGFSCCSVILPFKRLLVSFPCQSRLLAAITLNQIFQEFLQKLRLSQNFTLIYICFSPLHSR